MVDLLFLHKVTTVQDNNRSRTFYVCAVDESAACEYLQHPRESVTIEKLCRVLDVKGGIFDSPAVEMKLPFIKSIDNEAIISIYGEDNIVNAIQDRIGDSISALNDSIKIMQDIKHGLEIREDSVRIGKKDLKSKSSKLWNERQEFNTQVTSYNNLPWFKRVFKKPPRGTLI